MVSFDFNSCEQCLWVAKSWGRQGKSAGYCAPQLCPDQRCAACLCWCRYVCAHVSSWDTSYTLCAGLFPWLVLQKYHPRSRMGLTENVVCCGRTVRTMWGGQAGQDPLHWYDLTQRMSRCMNRLSVSGDGLSASGVVCCVFGFDFSIARCS